MHEDILKRAKEVLTIEGNALFDLAESIDSSFADAVTLLMGAAGRIVVTGMGKSGIVGRKISATFSSVGMPSFFLHPAEAIHGDLGMIRRDDVILAISNSGESEELIRLLPILNRFGLKMIAMCGRADSTLARRGDVFIDIGVKEEACPWDIVPTASTTAALAMGDALAIVVMEKRGFRKEDFAEFHPGGSLGRGMLVKVDDLMHTGKEVPIVNADVTLKTVINEITAKKLGMTLVVDSEGKVKGVITDGDLRRLFQRAANPSGKLAKEIMSPSPRTISSTATGGAAVKLMEENKITSLVCVNGSGDLQGIIHLHDLLRAGVV